MPFAVHPPISLFSIRSISVSPEIARVHSVAYPRLISVSAATKLRLQIGQRLDAVVAGDISGRRLLNGQRDEKAQFGDLAGDGLDVHAEDAVLNQVQFAAEVPRSDFQRFR